MASPGPPGRFFSDGAGLYGTEKNAIIVAVSLYATSSYILPTPFFLLGDLGLRYNNPVRVI
jgi:hypothetical protein